MQKPFYQLLLICTLCVVSSISLARDITVRNVSGRPVEVVLVFDASSPKDTGKLAPGQSTKISWDDKKSKVSQVIACYPGEATIAPATQTAIDDCKRLGGKKWHSIPVDQDKATNIMNMDRKKLKSNQTITFSIIDSSKRLNGYLATNTYVQ